MTEFAEDVLTVSNDAFVSTATIWRQYQKWFREYSGGHGRIYLNMNLFSRKLRALGLSKTRTEKTAGFKVTMKDEAKWEVNL